MENYIDSVLSKMKDAKFKKQREGVWKTTNLREDQDIPELIVLYDRHEHLYIGWVKESGDDTLFSGWVTTPEEFDNVLKYLRIDE